MVKKWRITWGSALLLAALLIGGCAGLAPVGKAGPRLAFPQIGEVLPRWEPLAPGLDYFAGSIRSPRLEFRALRVDLEEPGLKIVVNGDRSLEKGPVGEGSIPSTRVSSFVRRYGCLGGINTAPFEPSSSREGEHRTIVGLAIRAGELLSPPHPSFDALVFYKPGWGGGPPAAIISQAEAVPGEIETAAGGFYAILREGALAERLLDTGAEFEGGLDHQTTRPSNLPPPREPRSAGGLSANGKILYLLVIDGRQFPSVGATQAETGLLLKALGAYNGINFDGGGSSSLALRLSDGRFRPVNTPVHNRLPGWERAVAACLGIAPEAGEF